METRFASRNVDEVTFDLCESNHALNVMNLQFSQRENEERFQRAEYSGSNVGSYRHAMFRGIEKYNITN